MDDPNTPREIPAPLPTSPPPFDENGVLMLQVRTFTFSRVAPCLVGTTIFLYFWFLGFEVVSPTRRLLTELVLCVAAILLVGWASRDCQRWRWILIPVMAFLTPWVTLSLHETVFSGVLMTRPPILPPQSKQSDLSVNLSGGGLRAALMHSGTLDALVRLNVRPRFLTSVSGGSIIASYYLLGFDPAYFPRLAHSGVLRVTPKLRNLLTLLRIASPERLFGSRISWSVSRTDLLAQALDEAYLDGKTFRDLPKESPVFLIATTDILSGSGIGITRTGLLEIPAIRAYLRQDWNNLRSLRKDVQAEIGIDRNAEVQFIPVDFNPRLSRYVSASGAFPGAFSPVPLTTKWTSIEPLYDLGGGIRAIPKEQEQRRTFLLADGGITDNTGYIYSEAMRHLSIGFLRRDLIARYYLQKLNHTAAYKKAFVQFIKRQPRPGAGWRYKHLLVSDAGERFSDASNIKGILAQASRSLDVVYSNTGFGRLERFPDRDQSKMELMPSKVDCLAEKEKQQLMKRSPPNCNDTETLSRFTAGSMWLQTMQEKLGTVESRWLLGPHSWPELNTISTGDTFRMLVDTYRTQKCEQATALLDEEVWRVLQASDPGLADSVKIAREDLKALADVCPGGHTTEPVNNIDDALASRINRAKTVFDQTATLDDSISLADAEQIAFLGRISVLVNWPAIRKRLLITN